MILQLSRRIERLVALLAKLAAPDAGCLGRLVEHRRSSAEMSKQIPDSHLPMRVDRGNTAHLEVGEFGPTDSIRLFGLPMQRLAMLRPPEQQMFQLPLDAFNQSEKIGKDKGMSVDDPLTLARSVASADFKGLTEWFRPGKATVDAIQQLETARRPGVTQADDTTNGQQLRGLAHRPRWHICTFSSVF